MRRWTETLARFDWSLLLAAVSLTAIGLLAIFGVGISQDVAGLVHFNKQLLAVAIGLLLVFIFTLIDYRQLRSLALPIYGSGFLLLVLVLVIGHSNRNGGKWFEFGSLSFQPVEFAKITLVIFLAAYLARHAQKRLTWTAFFGSLVALMGYVIPVLLQPDFGSATVLIATWGVLVLFCGLPRHAWWIILLVMMTAAPLVWNVGLKPYQRQRITSFYDPTADLRGAAYNVNQAKIAIGSGGLLGKGVGEGSQARLRFLPEAATDFIFAVIGEELGFVGIFLLLSLFAFMLYRLNRIAIESQDPFAGICLVGFSTIITFHLLINAGMNLGLMPVTGIPLPFASAAASSLLMLFIAIGIAEAVAVQSRGSFA